MELAQEKLVVYVEPLRLKESTMSVLFLREMYRLLVTEEYANELCLITVGFM